VRTHARPLQFRGFSRPTKHHPQDVSHQLKMRTPSGAPSGISRRSHDVPEKFGLHQSSRYSNREWPVGLSSWRVFASCQKIRLQLSCEPRGV
jgi:hypothetical protein